MHFDLDRTDGVIGTSCRRRGTEWYSPAVIGWRRNTSLSTLAKDVLLDYDFNSPPGQDGFYRVVVDRGWRAHQVGTEVRFGDSEVEARGVVRGVVMILVVERTTPITSNA